MEKLPVDMTEEKRSALDKRKVGVEMVKVTISKKSGKQSVRLGTRDLFAKRLTGNYSLQARCGAMGRGAGSWQLVGFSGLGLACVWFSFWVSVVRDFRRGVGGGLAFLG